MRGVAGSRRARAAALTLLLAAAVAQGQLVIGDIDGAASFWLDGLIGHVRGVPRGGAELDQWSRTFARLSLRAVSG